MDKIKVICGNESCKKEFYRKSYHYNQVEKNGGKHYCSLRCVGFVSNRLDIIGKTFNKLTCIKEASKPKSWYKGVYYLFLCLCGNEHIANGSYVKSGRIKCCKKCKPTRKSDNPLWSGVGEISGGWWYKHIVMSANNRGLELSITIKEIWEIFLVQNGKCAYTDLPIYFPPTNADIGTASLDRINSTKGYIKGNVQWVHKDINSMKMDKLEDRFVELCNLVATKHNL